MQSPHESIAIDQQELTAQQSSPKESPGIMKTVRKITQKVIVGATALMASDLPPVTNAPQAVASSPLEIAAIDRVDLIEINHLYDLQGRLVIRQVIFYDWCQASGRFQVRAWRLLKNENQIPHRRWSHDDYKARWIDMNVLREVSAHQVRETATTYDPEVQEREIFPMENRKELSPPPKNLRSVVAETQQISG